MTKDEAMRLALEALENTTPTGFNMERDKQFFAAITALREALAEQPAQQKPVAYIHRQGNHYEVSERFLSDDEKARGWTEEPLYTSPPAQRKPLTDDEIADILPDDDTPMSLGEAFIKFARAIEAAHNIKGDA